MKCILIDDEELPRVILKQLIGEVPKLELVESFQRPEDALRYLNHHEDIALIFLDVSMPGFNGFEFIQTLKTVPAIILVTAHKDHAVTAFEYDNVVDYLLKPVTGERLRKAVEKASRHYRDNQISQNELGRKQNEYTEGQDLYIQNDKKLVKIDIRDILLIEAKGNYILIKTSSGNYITYSSLKNIESKLPSNIFIRIHRSFLINFSKIVDIQDNSVLINKEVVPVSRRYKPSLLKRLNKL
ncbi:LytR/AlgR family response regulator transcription factor [Salinimicrobium sp. GXAS 041]|uniref:LytR/AlgR family response regulator transcription factor n=1 Tax=Salinimicrobium sp. GXAS 041 TaxID=3400806 RepID=UPI003C76AD2A